MGGRLAQGLQQVRRAPAALCSGERQSLGGKSQGSCQRVAGRYRRQWAKRGRDPCDFERYGHVGRGK